MKLNISYKLKILAVGALVLLSWQSVEAVNIPVDCGVGGSGVGTAVNAASPGDIVQVTGSCNESFTIRNEVQRVTIDGGGTASITGTSGTRITVRGKGILIKGFTISGGSNGISVERGSNAVIDNNIIQNGTTRGIVVNSFAFAVITNNTIQGWGIDGIGIYDNSTARIGYNANSETVASPNTIQNNVRDGISISYNSSARIFGNVISNNGGDGVQVSRASAAQLSSNTINGNGTAFVPGGTDGNGVHVSTNSSVQLGDNDPVDFKDFPNTTTVNNANAGIRCTTGGAVRGHLGSTNQLMGAVSQFGGGSTANTFSGNCPTAAANLDIP